MTPADVSSAVVAAMRAASGGEPVVPVVPAGPLRCLGAGVYTSPAALRLASATGRPAMEIAGLIAEWLAGQAGIERVAAEHPGFVIITVGRPGALANAIVAAGESVTSVAEGASGWADRPRTFDNPGFVVRYAYARAAALRRRAADLGIERGDAAILRHEHELALLGRLGELPERTARSVRQGDTAPLRWQLVRVADGFHTVYERCPALPAGERKPEAVHGARLTLAEAVRIALSDALHMIGETPRERM